MGSNLENKLVDSLVASRVWLLGFVCLLVLSKTS